MRKRRLSAKSNRGKAGEVLVHNLMAGLSQRAADRKKAAASCDKALKRARKLRDAEYAKKREAQERERLKKEKARQDGYEKGRKFIKRSILLCRKHGIDELCAIQIAVEAVRLDAKLSELESAIVKPQLELWVQRGHVLRQKHEKRKAEKLLLARCQQICARNNIPQSYGDQLFALASKSPTPVNYVNWSPPDGVIEELKSRYADEVQSLDNKLAETVWAMQVPIRLTSSWSLWWLIPMFMAAIPIFGLGLAVFLILFKKHRFLGWLCLTISALSTFLAAIFHQ